MSSKSLEASVRGYHSYLKDATVVIGEVLMCERELDNAYNKYAVALNNEQGKVNGHVPIELSKLFARFIRNYGEVEAECIGGRCGRYSRGEGKGLEFPVDYKLSERGTLKSWSQAERRKKPHAT